MMEVACMKISNTFSLINNNNLRLHYLSNMTATERLSSALRINSAADDPSGMAISVGMRATIGGLNEAIGNIQDGLCLIQTADAAAGEIQDLINRGRDLAVRAANDAVLTDDDKQRIQNEIDSIIDGITQIAEATTYNTKQLLTGGSGVADTYDTQAQWNTGTVGAGLQVTVAGDLQIATGSTTGTWTSAVMDTQEKYGSTGVLPTASATPGGCSVQIELFESEDGSSWTSLGTFSPGSAFSYNSQFLYAEVTLNGYSYANPLPPPATLYVTPTVGSFTLSAADRQLLQVGENEGEIYTADVYYYDLRSSALGLTGVDVTSGNEIEAFDSALTVVSNARESYGQTAKVLDHILNDITAQKTNIAASNSRIEDAQVR